MGLLTGKFKAGSTLPSSDVRGGSWDWVPWFKDGKPVPEFLTRLAPSGRSCAATVVR